MNDEEPLFVETTIFIWRITKSREVKQRIQRTLDSRRCVTSTYVRAEYLNTFLRAAVDAYGVCVKAANLHDAWSHAQTRRGGQKELVPTFSHWAVDQGRTREGALRILRRFIEDGVMGWFDEAGCQLQDPTNCAAGDVLPRLEGGVFVMGAAFPPKAAPAGLKQFLQSGSTRVNCIYQRMNQEPGDHSGKVTSALADIQNQRFNLGIRKWQRLGDTIIALEARSVGCGAIYTGNVTHFTPLCQALSIAVRPEHP